MSSARLDPVLRQVDADLPNALERLFGLLRIPSVSTDPAHAADCTAAAHWLVGTLAGLGFDASLRPTPGHPMVVAHGGPEGGRRLLAYGHYDVQPVDPLTLWSHPPFDPVIEDREGGPVIRARGASDDKGQLMTLIEAARAWIAVHGALPVRLVMFLEGEEESGSPSLVPFLRAHADELRADLALICDTGLFADRNPAIVTQLRGLLGEEIVLTGPAMDLHSGHYGGAAANPIRVLARVLAALHDATGRVTIPGFYDGVPEVPAAQMADWQALGFDPAAFLGEVGLSHPAGETGRSVLEMIWSRPTCEINGISGGYTGAGFKTVLPAQARAKVSFRLVGTQDPLAIRASFRAMVRDMLPPDVGVEFHDHGASPASRMDISAPAFGAAQAALAAEWGLPAACIGAGGSIPVAGHFREILGMESLLTGFAKDSDLIHSPNEKYDLDSFHKGIRSWVRIFDALSQEETP